MNIRQQFVILSGENKDATFEGNRQRTDSLEISLNELNFNPTKTEGKYMGDTEKSFIVPFNSLNELEILKGLAFQSHKQESILLSDSNGLCHLIFSDGTTHSIGYFKKVNKDLQDILESYTMIKDELYIVA